eukprot:scaffold109431_cov48-Phaeocystis_antarctica.AAC.1
MASRHSACFRHRTRAEARPLRTGASAACAAAAAARRRRASSAAPHHAAIAALALRHPSRACNCHDRPAATTASCRAAAPRVAAPCHARSQRRARERWQWACCAAHAVRRATAMRHVQTTCCARACAWLKVTRESRDRSDARCHARSRQRPSATCILLSPSRWQTWAEIARRELPALVAARQREKARQRHANGATRHDDAMLAAEIALRPPQRCEAMQLQRRRAEERRPRAARARQAACTP